MSWKPELDELVERQDLAAQMGGAEGIARQHGRGKLTVRERIPLLADAGTFREFGGLRGQGTYDEHGMLTGFTPQGRVEGMCEVDGRKIVVTAGDFTVRGGSGGGTHGGLGEETSASERALEWRLPYVRLLDAAGGSVRSFEDLGRTYLPDGNSFTYPEIELMNQVPVVSAVMGAAAGIGALHTSLSHWNVMVAGTQVFPGGPPVVKAALGIDITKEELGGPQVHTQVSGVVDNFAATEAEAIAMIRDFLSYLPSSVDELAPRHEAFDPVDHDPDDLRHLVPKDPRKTHDARRLVKLVVDDGSFFEIAPRYGRARITGLARIDGYPVGIMANDPRHMGGATDVAAGMKAARLIQLCDLFHLPLVDLVDEPGLMVGLDSERAGIERAGARLVCITNLSRTPWIAIVVRRLYGVGGQAHHRPRGMFRRYAWPSARWGSMHIAGGASAAYRREIEAADDPEAKRIEIEERLDRLGSPFRTAEATGQDIIDPADTRAVIAEFIDDAQRLLVRQLGVPPTLPYLP